MEASQVGTATIAHGRALPLNTRRLTKALFQALAQGLELSPTAGSGRVEAHNGRKVVGDEQGPYECASDVQ